MKKKVHKNSCIECYRNLLNKWCAQFFFSFFACVCSKMTPGKVNAHDNASNADISLPTAISPDETAINENKDVKKSTVSMDTDVSSSVDKPEQKINDTAQKVKPFDEKLKLDVSIHPICIKLKFYYSI